MCYPVIQMENVAMVHPSSATTKKHLSHQLFALSSHYISLYITSVLTVLIQCDAVYVMCAAPLIPFA